MSRRCLSMFFRSLFLQAGFCDERRQALGFAWALDPAPREAYPADPRGLSQARARHLESFNTNPCAVGLILGTTAALEAGASASSPALARMPAAAASLAAAADPFFWGALRPLSAASAVFVASCLLLLRLPHPFFWGAACGLAVFNVPAFFARWEGLRQGLSKGESALLWAGSLPVQSWIRASRLAAFAVLAAAALAALAAGPGVSALAAAVAFAAGASLSRIMGGPLRLVTGAGILGMIASAGGWLP